MHLTFNPRASLYKTPNKEAAQEIQRQSGKVFGPTRCAGVRQMIGKAQVSDAAPYPPLTNRPSSSFSNFFAFSLFFEPAHRTEIAGREAVSSGFRTGGHGSGGWVLEVRGSSREKSVLADAISPPAGPRTAKPHPTSAIKPTIGFYSSPS